MFKNRDLWRILVTQLAVLVAIVTGLGAILLLNGAEKKFNGAEIAQRALGN